MRSAPLFQDREDAGRRLAGQLQEHATAADVLVLGLPRGGVPVAYEVARALGAELDVFIVRKLGVPGHEELAMGAIASGDVVVLNEHVLAQTGITDEALGEVAERERLELERREHLYRGDRPLPEITGRTIILIDDGLATGASVRAAVAALRRQQPGRLIVAVPVAAASTCDLLRPEVDELICLAVPNPFYGVGAWYADFSQTTDDQVRTLLEHARSFAGAHGHE